MDNATAYGAMAFAHKCRATFEEAPAEKVDELWQAISGLLDAFAPEDKVKIDGWRLGDNTIGPVGAKLAGWNVEERSFVVRFEIEARWWARVTYSFGRHGTVDFRDIVSSAVKKQDGVLRAGVLKKLAPDPKGSKTRTYKKRLARLMEHKEAFGHLPGDRLVVLALWLIARPYWKKGSTPPVSRRNIEDMLRDTEFAHLDTDKKIEQAIEAAVVNRLVSQTHPRGTTPALYLIKEGVALGFALVPQEKQE